MLTNARVRDLKPRDTMYEVTCEALGGFVVRVLPTGKKVFLVRHNVDGKTRRERLGLLSAAFGVEEARRQACAILGVEAPVEPAITLPPAPPLRLSAPPAPRSVEPLQSQQPRQPTIRTLADRFLREFVDVYLKSGTAQQYRRHLRRHIIPRFGDRDFTTITRAEVQALHASLAHVPATANYVVNIISSLYHRIIIDWELANIRSPAHRIKLFKMKVRERFLSPEERQQMYDTIQAGLRIPAGRKGHLDRNSVWALQILALTGMRRTEVLDLTWPMVDWQHSCLRLPDSKTGQRVISVSSQVIELLRQIHAHAGAPKQGRVVGSRTGLQLSSLNNTWETIRERLEIPEVRLHDLRHSFASDALMGGVPLAVVGEMLGHRQPTTTKRYAHLANSVVRNALEHTAGRITAAHTASSNAPVLLPFEPVRDDQWKPIASLVDAERGRGGKPVDLRQILDGVRWVLHHKARWTDLPASYGVSTTCWRWYQRWCERDVWPKIEAILGTTPLAQQRRPRPRPRPSSIGLS